MPIFAALPPCCRLLLPPADSADLILASTNFTVGSTGSQKVLVQLGMLGVEASFDQLAWAGMYYPRPRQSTSTIIIHAIIVGAQVRLRPALAFMTCFARLLQSSLPRAGLLGALRAGIAVVSSRESEPAVGGRGCPY
jgi:hypothetical protein